MDNSSEMIQDLQKELTCSVCMDYFINPVSIECGHSFCHNCLFRTWQEAPTPFSCPECRSVSELREFKANVRLGKLAAIAKKLRPHCLQYPGGYAKCEVHQKKQKLFCEDDQSPVCVSCFQSQEHEAHKLCYIDEAAENFREKLQEIRTHLWRKTENIVKQRTNEKFKFVLIKGEMEIQKKNIETEFEKMNRFLDEEKIVHLSHIQTEGKASLESLNKRICTLSYQSQELRKRITELEEECKKPDVDLLKDMEEVLTRNESVLQRETEILPIIMPMCTIPGIIKRISNFKVDITLDCNTADPGLIISEDLKSVRYGGVQEEVQNNHGRFIHFAKVLATQSFISRRCYWEVEMPNNTDWCVGIYKKSKGSRDFFVLMGIHKHNLSHLYALAQYNLNSQVHKKYRQIIAPNLKVGIFLDYKRREISFYHVKERYLIYTFPNTSFSGLITPLFCLSKKVLTNVCSLTICP